MALLRACAQSTSLARRSGLAVVPTLVRGVASDSSKPVPSPGEHKSGEIVVPPTRDVLPADVISGAPEELQHRSVRIFQPTRNTMQSGSAKTERWRIDFDILPGSARWENPLMGWAARDADYMQGTRISFRSKEDAVHFAEKQGEELQIDVQQPAVKRIPPKNYAENYVYKPHKLRI
ncbi:Ndufs4, NADH dehydrogenase Fe-S protein 4 [Pholiota molesta]|nr:Ndufs4, NADH dehydrogenase Fe-S protein 4 [Pholiota molesta]